MSRCVRHSASRDKATFQRCQYKRRQGHLWKWKTTERLGSFFFLNTLFLRIERCIVSFVYSLQWGRTGSEYFLLYFLSLLLCHSTVKKKKKKFINFFFFFFECVLWIQMTRLLTSLGHGLDQGWANLLTDGATVGCKIWQKAWSRSR